jgi:hypothetical protein
LREEHSLRVFESRALRGMFGPRREQSTGNWRRMYNEEHREFFCSLNVTEVMKLWMGWACGMYRGQVKSMWNFDQEGKKEDRKEGRKGGKKERRKEGRKEGRKEERKEERKGNTLNT